MVNRRIAGLTFTLAPDSTWRHERATDTLIVTTGANVARCAAVRIRGSRERQTLAMTGLTSADAVRALLAKEAS